MEQEHKKSKIYTKTGDKGLTSLVGGKRIAKSHERLDAYGTIDELNSFIGLLIEEIKNSEDIDFLKKIQSLLFVVGCELATECGTESFLKLTTADIELLEKEIDAIDALLPKLSGFVLPGGSKSASICHICRTVCRRAERYIYKLNESEPIENQILIFINRLSDYFFVLARKLCIEHNNYEIIWNNT